MHSFVAQSIYRDEIGNLSLKDIAKHHPDKRQVAKSAGFAINYGGNGFTIANNLNVSKELGEQIYEGYLAAFPGLESFFNSKKEQAKKDGFILFNNVTKRKHYIYRFQKFKELERIIDNRNFWNEYKLHKTNRTEKFNSYYKPLIKEYFFIKGDIERMALNYPIQGTSSDITKLAGILFFKWIIENNLFNIVKIVNIVHDEYVVECREDLAKITSDNLKRCMEEAGDVFCKLVKLKATPVIGDVWKH